MFAYLNDEKKFWVIFIVLFSLLVFQPALGYGDEGDKSLKIGALGKFQPAGGMVEIVGISGARITEILVPDGALIKEGQVLAKFDNREDLKYSVNLKRLQLAELEANFKHDDNVQRLKIAKTKSDLNRAEKRLANYLALVKSAQAQTVLETRKGDAESARHVLRIESGLLPQIKARFEGARSKLVAQIEKSEKDLEMSTLYSPIDATVIETLRRVGQNAGGPIFLVADLSTMRVECEIYEGDMAQIKVGMPAEVTSKAFAGKIAGKVSKIGRRVDAVRKVAKVWVELNESDVASQYIDMEVNVTIDTAK